MRGVARGDVTTAPPRRPAAGRGRVLRALCLVALPLALAVPVLSAVTVASPAPAAAAAGAPPSCPTADTCVTVPCAVSPCPTVEAGPTTDLGVDGGEQYVFVDLYDYPVGSVPVVYYCTDTTALSKAPPLCASAPAPKPVQVFPDGTAQSNYQVEEVLNDGESPLSGSVPGKSGSAGTFFCDDGPDPCSLDVYDFALDGQAVPDPANTAVVPVSFVPQSKGCPGASIVDTESDFGIEGLLTQVAPAACKKGDVVPVDTAVDSAAAVQALAGGTAQIAFTDDPLGSDERATLTGAGHSYAYIPLVATADVVGFEADDAPSTHPLQLYPQTQFQLTPDMVAGLVSGQDGTPGLADQLHGVACPNPNGPPPKTLKSCPAMEVLNAVPGYLPPEAYWTTVRSDTAGATDALFGWLCGTPQHTVPIDGTTQTETGTAAQVLAAAGWTSSAQQGTCPNGDQVPPLSAPQDWGSAATPAKQAEEAYAELTLADPPRNAVFVELNWYEALYYGFGVAQLENAAGQFVAPTQASVDAALADATVDPATGVLVPSPTDPNPDAYVMPVVEYAVVPTGSTPGAGTAAVGAVLRSILAATTGPASGLPSGLVPLPATLAAEAESMVAKDFPAPKAPSSGKGTTTKPPSHGGTQQGTASTAGAGTTGGSGSGAGTTGFDTGSGVSFGSTAGGSVSGANRAVTGHAAAQVAARPRHPTAPAAHMGRTAFLRLAPLSGRWFLVVLLAAGVTAILVGPTLLAALRPRRRPDTEEPPPGPPVPAADGSP